jgi:octaprenyl-diphosphate synthase
MNDYINKLIAPDITLLNSIIRTDLNSEIVLIRQISEYIINSGGKRIRPIITILCGKIAGYTGEYNLLHKMAAMIEYIHTATLLHDDIVDESQLRRGRKTANSVFGNAASVLVGDFIYTRSFQMMVESNSLKLLKLMADSTNKISEGEVLQLLNIGRTDLTVEDYFAVINSKTGVLFEAAARVAAIVANADNKTEHTLAEFAKNIGTAFQIVDDILDYTGEAATMGKNVGEDLLEGKVTLPLIYLLHNSNPNTISLIQQAISNPKNVDIKQIIELILQSDAINYCKQIATKHVNNAISALDIFANSQYKEALVAIATDSISRIK